MSNIQRYLMAGSLGLTGFVSPTVFGADVAEKPRYEDISEVPVIRDSTFKARTSEGFTVVIVYISNSNIPDYEDRIRGVNAVLNSINEINSPNINTYRYDTMSILEVAGGTDTAVTNHLKKIYGIESRPSLLLYCDGLEVYKKDGITLDNPDNIKRAEEFFTAKIKSALDDCI
jgi:hypothetical protein